MVFDAWYASWAVLDVVLCILPGCIVVGCVYGLLQSLIATFFLFIKLSACLFSMWESII